MINLSKALNFEKYYERSTEDERAKQIEAHNRAELSEKIKTEVKTIKNPTNVVVFSEGFCPDCAATLPFVEKMHSLNHNIKVFIFPREGNEEILKEYTGDARIPTVLTFTDNMAPKGAYIEFPDDLKAKISNKEASEQKALIKEYREGKYNDLIEEELLKIIK